MAIGDKMTKIVLGVVVAGLMLGYVFPVGLNAINENPTYEVTADENVQTQITGPLEFNVTSSTVGSSATIELINTDTGDTESQTINEGNSVEYNNIDGGTVNVTLEAVNSGGETTAPNVIGITAETGTGFGWSGASKSIFGVIGIFLVLVPLIALAKEAMDA